LKTDEFLCTPNGIENAFKGIISLPQELDVGGEGKFAAKDPFNAYFLDHPEAISL
jgi:hypothetical protein